MRQAEQSISVGRRVRVIACGEGSDGLAPTESCEVEIEVSKSQFEAFLVAKEGDRFVVRANFSTEAMKGACEVINAITWGL